MAGLIRRVWNGPFYIGVLQQPASIGDVLLKILEVLWRIFLILAATLAIFFAYFALVHDQLFPPLREKVEADVIFDPAVSPQFQPDRTFEENISLTAPWCHGERPIRLVLFNRSDAEVVGTTFSIEAFESGLSKNVILDGGWLTSDQIIPPGEHRISCLRLNYAAGVDPSKLRYEVEMLSAKVAN